MDICGLVASKPRDRIVSTARELFRKHGIRGVGVDAIAEAAATNKMTLYRHFGSKDDLIVACLRDVAREVDVFWEQIEAAHPNDPFGKLHAWLLIGAECVGSDARGCDLANAAVELAEASHPARHFIEEFKRDQRDRLARLCAEAGIAKPELLADTLSLLLEGARVSRQSVGVAGPCARFIAIGEAVIEAFSRQAGRNLAQASRRAAAKSQPKSAGAHPSP